MASSLFSTGESFARAIPSDSNSSATTDYSVQDHDTLCSIAVTFNTTTSVLKKMNKMASSMLFPGQVIRVPQHDSAVTAGIEANEEAKNIKENSEYNFLAPLSVSPTSSSTNKPFRDLAVVSTVEQSPNADKEDYTKLSSSDRRSTHSGSRQASAKSFSSATDDASLGRSSSTKRDRLTSVDSNMSEPFEENFIKMNVYYVTSSSELVHGVFLTTPTSIMFDPLEQGCEKFGILCDLTTVISIAVYNDTRNLVKKKSIDLANPTRREIAENREDSDPNSYENVDDLDVEPDEPSEKESSGQNAKPDESNKLSFEFPFLHSLVKTVEDYLPGITHLTDDKLKSSVDSEKGCLYLCIKSETAMMKTFSVLTALNDASNEVEKRENEVKEAWFQIPGEKSDQLFAFFMQWCPDSYAVDFVEQNGFIDASTVAEKKAKKPSTIIVKEEEVRSRSSTNSSLEFIDDYFGDADIKKEWELISAKEAARREKLNANELANDDTSLMPEMLHTSNLIKEDALLELCRHIPARCVGCPWRLLYSTFEHGTSLRTLYRNMNQRMDDTPAVVIIQDDDNHIFGAFCSSRPHVSEHFYGSGESFLFTVDPKLEFFEWTGENTFFVKGDIDALMFGGGDGTAGLWLDGDLRHGRSKPCFTFNNSLLSSTEDFFIQGLEVWGFEDS